MLARAKMGIRSNSSRQNSYFRIDVIIIIKNFEHQYYLSSSQEQLSYRRRATGFVYIRGRKVFERQAAEEVYGSRR
jgi:hypothetical protein